MREEAAQVPGHWSGSWGCSGGAAMGLRARIVGMEKDGLRPDLVLVSERRKRRGGEGRMYKTSHCSHLGAALYHKVGTCAVVCGGHRLRKLLLYLCV